MKKISVSTVIPIYSGKDYLPALVAELAELRAIWNDDNAPLQLIESIFVDDASNDNSAAVLEELAKQYTWIRIVTLSKNFGQHPATIAGILYSAGDWVATLDEDLQHHPKHIIDMLKAAVTRHVDIVYARPLEAVHRKGYRDITSRSIKHFLAWSTGNAMLRHFNSFRLMRGSIARSAASVCGHETYFDVALSWFADKFTTIDLALEDSRFIKTGRSGYNFRKLMTHARRLLLSSQPKILRGGAVFGFLAMLIAMLLTGRIFYNAWFGPHKIDVRGWSSLFVGIIFFGGVSALLLGIVLEYLTNIVLHTQGKPVFFQVDRSSDVLLREYFSQTD
jgi:glycosyltransferase involved in cell wall biosynthesis